MRIKFFLTLILLLGLFLRLYKLGDVPISPDWDEVALGYNAYSILQTGKDEYGKSFPVVLRSFDDYKPALYAYFSIPTIRIFGLDTYAVRLPSAIFGIISVFITFLLVKELFKNEKISLLSSFLLAISPWALQFSRIAFEASVGMSLNLLAILFFLYGLKRSWFLFLSMLLFGLSIYVYQAEKVFIPLIILFLIFIYKEKLLLLNKKYLAGNAFLLFAIVLPMMFFLITNKNSLLRARGVSIFSESISFSQAQKISEDKKNKDFLGLFFDNTKAIYAKRVVEGYLSHFDLNWLFINGDLARHHAPNMGLLYLWEVPFLFIGIYSLFFGKFDKKSKLLLFSWFLLSPVPAMVTSGVPSAVRTLNFLPTFQIFCALGLFYLYQRVSNRKFSRSLFAGLTLLIIFNFIYYCDQYFVQQGYENAKYWQYGYKEAISYLKTVEKDYPKIIVSNKSPMDQSYMFFLFYLKYPPLEYQKYSSSGGFAESHKFGKFEFRPMEYSREQRGTLLIGRPEDFPANSKILKTIYYPDGSPDIKFVSL